MVAFNMQVRPVRMCAILVQLRRESISGHATTPAYSGAIYGAAWPLPAHGEGWEPPQIEVAPATYN
jgi:hypothetical protein